LPQRIETMNPADHNRQRWHESLSHGSYHTQPITDSTNAQAYDYHSTVCPLQNPFNCSCN